jgi:nitrogen-specific signal transduction histidine kinase/CheY-like chemotaxis protein
VTELQEQLRQAQKMEAVGQMAGGIAHDFNNLLQVVSGYAELLKHECSPSDAAVRSLDEIVRAALRGKSLVGQLMTFCRRNQMEPVSLDVNEVLRGLLGMLDGLMGEHISLVFNAGAELCTVCVDRGMLEQVLVNLCLNSRDAMPDGGVVTITTANVLADQAYAQKHSLEKEGEYVLICVEDTGVGIEDHAVNRVFEPFFTTKDVGKGTGLGLSVVYGIVTQHSGQISLKSSLGEGTTFEIHLPAVEQTPAEKEEKSKSGRAAVKGGAERILVAEDDVALLRLAEVVLTKAGYRVALAHDGQEAVNLFMADPEGFDLVMCDVVMPNMSGPEAVDTILKKNPRCPYLFVSGYQDERIRKDLAGKYEGHILSKPYRAEVLLQTVRENLDKKPISPS